MIDFPDAMTKYREVCSGCDHIRNMHMIEAGDDGAARSGWCLQDGCTCRRFVDPQPVDEPVEEAVKHEDKVLEELRNAHITSWSGHPRPTPPDDKGRIIVARSKFAQGKTSWLRPGAPGWWMVWLLATRNLLRKTNVSHVVVHYVEGHVPPAHEYRLMTPEQMDEENAQTARASLEDAG